MCPGCVCVCVVHMMFCCGYCLFGGDSDKGMATRIVVGRSRFAVSIEVSAQNTKLATMYAVRPNETSLCTCGARIEGSDVNLSQNGRVVK